MEIFYYFNVHKYTEAFTYQKSAYYGRFSANWRFLSFIIVCLYLYESIPSHLFRVLSSEVKLLALDDLIFARCHDRVVAVLRRCHQRRSTCCFPGVSSATLNHIADRSEATHSSHFGYDGLPPPC